MSAADDSGRTGTAAPSRGWGRPDWIAAVAVLALWLLARPYRGVRHDATLYLGQALVRLLPERFATDLFLHAPAQDRYSIFSPLLAPLVQHFGIGGPEIVLLACCHVLFLVAVWKLSEPWADRPLRWAMLAFAAGMPHTYGGLGEFSYAEPFLTARSFAEPLALLALWQLLRQRLLPAIVLAGLSAAFHPLIALPVVVVGWITLVMKRRAWAWLALVMVVPVLLAVLGVPPFPDLARSLDPEWLAVVRDVTPQVFAASYTRLDWSPLAFDVLVLGLLLQSRRTPAAMTGLVRATLAAALVLTIAWVIGADVLHNVLLAQLQLWRIYWPLHLLAVMALPSVLAEAWARGWHGRWLAAGVAVAGVAVVSNWGTGWACIAWALVAWAVERWNLAVSGRIAKGAMLASCVGMLAISAEVTRHTLQALQARPDIARDSGPLLVVAGLPLVVGLLVLAFRHMLATGGVLRHVAAAAAIAGVVAGAPLWDQRSDWQRRLESSLEAGPPAFDGLIPPGAALYWDGDLLTPWLLAQHGSFHTRQQGSGVVFDRAMALELVRRAPVSDALDYQREVCRKAEAARDPAAAGGAACPPPADLVAAICRAPAHPDQLVFQEPLQVPPAAGWRSPRFGKSFYLYSCAQFH